MSGALELLEDSGPTLGETLACTSSWTLVGEAAGYCVLVLGFTFSLCIFAYLLGELVRVIRGWRA